MESLNVGLEGPALMEVGMGQAAKENEVKSETKEDVKSNTSTDKVNKKFRGSAKGRNTGAMSAKKSILVEGEVGGEEVMEQGEKKAPSICSCDLEFYNSKNLHANTSLKTVL